MNKKKTLKEGRGLWITPPEDDRFWMLVVWLMSEAEVTQAILAAEPEALAVISY